MVEADPDVPHALAAVVEKLLQQRSAAGAQLHARPVRAEHRGHGLLAQASAQQPAVRRVEVGKQRILDLELAWRARAAIGREGDRGVRAIGVLVDQQARRFKLARLAAGAQRESGKSVGGDVVLLRAQLAPGDGAVAVGV